MYRITLNCAALICILGTFSLLPASDNTTKADTQSAIGSNYIPVHRYDPGRNPADDIEQAVSEARKTGKRVLVDIGGDWCPWCHSLDEFFKEHTELLQLRDAGFITVNVYYGVDHKDEQALSHYSKVLGIPHFFVLDSDGLELCSQHVVELQTNGKYNFDKMKDFLVKWSPSSSKPR